MNQQIMQQYKGEIEKEVTGTRFVYFEPIVPRKNMTLSIFGSFKEIERAKEILKTKLESLKSVIISLFSLNYIFLRISMLFFPVKYSYCIVLLPQPNLIYLIPFQDKSEFGSIPRTCEISNAKIPLQVSSQLLYHR